MTSYFGAIEPVMIAAGKRSITGVLDLPPNPRGMILLSRDSSPRRASLGGNHLIEALRRAGLATLRLDPLGLDPQGSDLHRFDLTLLQSRLARAADWLGAEVETQSLPLGLFATGADAAAALQLAASRPERIAAVVCRGGRPELAGARVLGKVHAPTLLIVGEDDLSVIECNRSALEQLRCEKDLAVLRGATYPHGEAHTLKEAARLAARWFKGYVGADAQAAHRAPL